jgi:hypothetical protein
MPATVLTHVRNEELLLPFWLRHHRELFDHGVVVDRGSTDRTAEIVRELVPEWDLVQSRNPLFDARDTDLEMMDHERRFGGWKLVLNATELLLCEDLRGHLDSVERSSPEIRTIGIRTLGMVDPPEKRDTPLDDRPLLLQRHHHALEAAPGHALRFLHREPHGDYGPGRHEVPRPYALDPALAICKYLYSPYPQVRDRRVALGQGVPDADLRLGMSWGLFYTAEEMDELFRALSPRARDIASDPKIAAALARLERGYAAGPRRAAPRRPADPGRRVAIVGDAPAAIEAAASLSDAHEVRRAPAGGGDVDAAASWAEIVIADAAAYHAEAAVHRSWRPLVLDLSGLEPTEAPEGALLRGDFFLWDAPLGRAWTARLAEVGRLSAPLPPEAELALLGTGVGPASDPAERTERLEMFLRSPRRTTARIVVDSPLVVSRIAYFNRTQAAYDAVFHNTPASLDER